MAVTIPQASRRVRPKSSPSGWMAFGPAAIVVISVFGPGDLASNSASGSAYGYSLLWALAIAVVFKFILLEAAARYVLVTGDTLLQGYNRSGRWVVWTVLLAAIWKRVFSNLYLIVFMGVAAHFLLPLPTPYSRAIWSTVFTIIGFVMVFSGGYSNMERFCKYLIAALGVSLLIAAALSDPDPVGILRGFVPTALADDDTYTMVLLVTALIAAEAGTLGNVSYAYFVQEKGWTDVSALRAQRADLALGASSIFVMGALLQIAAAGTLRPLGVTVETETDLLRIFSDTQGWIGMIVFSFGLWGAAFSSYVGNGMGYGLMVTDIFRRFVPPWNAKSPARPEPRSHLGDPVYRWTVALWTLVPLCMAWADVDAILLAILVNALVVFLIPILTVALLRITSDPRLMGEYRNGAFTNVMMVVLLVISGYLIYADGGAMWETFVQALGALG